MSAQRGVLAWFDAQIAEIGDVRHNSTLSLDFQHTREARAAVAAMIDDVKAIREMGALMGMYTPGMDRRLAQSLARMDPQPGEGQ